MLDSSTAATRSLMAFSAEPFEQHAEADTGALLEPLVQVRPFSALFSPLFEQSRRGAIARHERGRLLERAQRRDRGPPA